MFVDNGVLMWVDVIGNSAGRGSSKVREELVFGIEGDGWEREFLEDRSGQSG